MTSALTGPLPPQPCDCSQVFFVSNSVPPQLILRKLLSEKLISLAAGLSSSVPGKLLTLRADSLNGIMFSCGIPSSVARSGNALL